MRLGRYVEAVAVVSARFAVGGGGFYAMLWEVRHLYVLLAAPAILATLFAMAFALAMIDQILPLRTEKERISD